MMKKFLMRKSKKETQIKTIAIPETVNSNKLLDGKTALIIGGTSGIGLSMAEEFLKHGCEVIIAGRSNDRLKEAINRIDCRLKGVVIDIRDIASFDDKIDECRQNTLQKKIDILVNCAGVRSETTFFDCKEEDYNSVFSTNVKGVYFMCQAMGRYMIKNGIKGHILNVSSSSALRPAQTPYQISKWAIRGMTLGLADALFPFGIIVNGIAPGPTATPMLGISEEGNIYQPAFQLGRYELPREIAQLAVFLVSSLGNVVVGDTLYASGGSGVISMHK